MNTNPRKQKSILGIDRGSKYIGVAYMLEGQSIAFPIGYLLNDQMIYFNISDLIVRHRVSTIVI